MQVQIGVQESHLIRPQVITHSISIIMVRVVAKVGGLHLLVIIVVSLAISARSVISHLEWEEICIHYLHSCQIGQMTMV